MIQAARASLCVEGGLLQGVEAPEYLLPLLGSELLLGPKQLRGLRCEPAEVRGSCYKLGFCSFVVRALVFGATFRTLIVTNSHLPKGSHVLLFGVRRPFCLGTPAKKELDHSLRVVAVSAKGSGLGTSHRKPQEYRRNTAGI